MISKQPILDRLKDSDILVGIVTSDFQLRTRWGWMGFENEYWDRTNWGALLYPEMMVDINHHNRTASGFMLSIEDIISDDYKRKQADWVEPKPMNSVIASFLIPSDTPCKKIVNEGVEIGRIGISIEHGGRKPYRFIGPYITLCHVPTNRDAWVIKSRIDGVVRDKMYPGYLPESIKSVANKHYDIAEKRINEHQIDVMYI